jgi:hypothetical protein
LIGQRAWFWCQINILLKYSTLSNI